MGLGVPAPADHREAVADKGGTLGLLGAEPEDRRRSIRTDRQDAQAMRVLEQEGRERPDNSSHSRQTPKSARRSVVSWNNTIPRSDILGSQVSKSWRAAS